MLIEAIHNIKYKKQYRMPGTPFDCEDKIAQKLIADGHATAAVDPEMLKIAKDKAAEVEKEIAELKKKIEADTEKNKKIRIEIDDLNYAAEKEKSAAKKKKLEKEAAKKSGKLVDTGELEDLLNKKGQQLKDYQLK